MALDVFSCKRIVTEYYESIRGNVAHGLTKYIATNGRDCLVVENDPNRWNNPEGYLFKCETRGGATYCELIN